MSIKKYKVIPDNIDLLEEIKVREFELKVFDSDPYVRCELYDKNGKMIKNFGVVTDPLDLIKQINDGKIEFSE